MGKKHEQITGKRFRQQISAWKDAQYMSLEKGESKQQLGITNTPVKVKLLSRVWPFVTPWTVAYQAPPSMGFSRQESWSGLPFPSPGDLPDPGIEPGSPALQARQMLSRLSHEGSPSTPVRNGEKAEHWARWILGRVRSSTERQSLPDTKWYSCVRAHWQCFTRWNKSLSRDPAIILLSIHPDTVKIYVHTESCRRMSIAALFTAAET